MMVRSSAALVSWALETAYQRIQNSTGGNNRRIKYAVISFLCRLAKSDDCLAAKKLLNNRTGGEVRKLVMIY